MKLRLHRWLPVAATVISLAVMACGSDVNPLERKVEESNRHLPEAMDYGMTLERIAYADSMVSAYIDVAGSEVRINSIRTHADKLKYGFAEYMRDHADSTEVGATIKLIKEQGATLRMMFYADADTVAILIPSEEL